jgi:alanine racemase
MGPAISPDEVAVDAGTNGYEVLTSLGRRFTRQYRCTEGGGGEGDGDRRS